MIEPLSDIIDSLADGPAPTLTVGEMLQCFDSRAFGAMLFVFGALNMLPLPPGSSTFLSLPILLLAPQVAWGADAPWLPRKVMARSLKRDDLRRLFGKISPTLRRIEKVSRPRLAWLFAPAGERLIGVVCTLLALVLVLPIPLGNLLPGAAVATLALALVQRDGLLAMAGYGLAATSAGVLVLSASVVIEVLRRVAAAIPGLS
jgi:hypothetical protein